tara:strand:- start:28657 stop:28860 length:204 start_codon:yes stop_codon:yes gene_type:complete
MINLTVNGKLMSFDKNINIMDLIKYYKLDTKFVAVGHNGDVVKKEHYSLVTLKDGDSVELVKPVGGG